MYVILLNKIVNINPLTSSCQRAAALEYSGYGVGQINRVKLCRDRLVLRLGRVNHSGIFQAT